MQTINDRIGLILDKSKLTKTAFGESLRVSQQYISKLIRTGNPSDLLIDDICQKYNVNEEWLRTGEGEMFKKLLDEDETAAYVSGLLEEPNNPLYEIILEIMRTYNELSPKSQEALREFSASLRDNLAKRKEG